MIFRKKKKRSTQEDREKLLVNFPLDSRFAEAYRTLRTNLFFSDMDNEVKSVLVTSAVEKEGKTTTAVNLGHTIAQTDRQVLLMDCDLRRPNMTKLFPDSPQMGVTDLVTEVFGVHLTQGGLDEYSVGDLVRLTRIQNRSVRLDLENDTTRAALFFHKGRLSGVRWLNRPDDEKPVAEMIRDDLLTEEQIRALNRDAIEAIRAVNAMETGRFSFSPFSGAEARASAGGPALDYEKLFARFKTDTQGLKYCHAAIDNAVVPTDVDNLFFLASGKTPPNPAELVGSGRMAFLMEILKSRFDFIVIDTPPVTPATDALLLAPLVDGTVLVVKSGNTDRKIIQDAIDQFKAVKQPIMGVVLNLVDMRKEGYYKYYHKYYSSYYGSK